MTRETGTGSTPPHRADTARLCSSIWPTLLLIAVIVTVLNAVKPLTMDDSAYFAYARQIAAHPLDPYGFQIFWSQWPEPANWLLAPPAIPYWWAIAIKFFGPSVFVWKLWLLPWIAAFVFGVHSLLKRFAPHVAVPMTVFTVFAPVYLPAINYMLDVPALGLGLLALSVAMRAIDRESIKLLAVSGLMFGLSLQTKYNVATLPVAAAFYGFSRRRSLRGLVPGVVAVLSFAAWEGFVADRYGHSHFLLHLHGPDLLEGKDPKYFLIVSVVPLMGTLAGPLALLIWHATGARPRVLIVSGIMLALCNVAVGFSPVSWMFLLLGVYACGTCAVGVWRFLRRANNRDDRFLLAWFLLEAIAFIAVSPFSASRRLMGTLLVLTLIVARMLDAAVDSPSQRRSLHLLVSLGTLVGLLFLAVDVLDARAEERGVERARQYVAARSKPGQTTYFVGHWGFQFYAERAGFRPLLPDETIVKPGDWIIAAQWPVNAQFVDWNVFFAPPVQKLSIDDPVHMETVPAFYGRLFAIDNRTGARLKIEIDQAKTVFVPVSNFSDQFIASWAITRPMPLMPASIPAVVRTLRSVDAKTADAIKTAIAASGPDALIAAARAGDPAVQAWANAELARLPVTTGSRHD